jgi:hypothetical protein
VYARALMGGHVESRRCTAVCTLRLRLQVESGLAFAGLLLMENKLKGNTADNIAKLHAASVRCNMVRVTDRPTRPAAAASIDRPHRVGGAGDGRPCADGARRGARVRHGARG